MLLTRVKHYIYDGICMSRNYLAAIGITLAGSALLYPGVTATAQVTVDRPSPQVISVSVSAKQPGQRIPDTIFGSFLEPIGNSINNGLSAEILVNRSLESGLWNHTNLMNLFHDQPELIHATEFGLPLPWEPLDSALGNRFVRHYGDAANSWQSLEIMGVPGSETGIKQKVYLPVQRTLHYTATLYARHLDGAPRISVSLRGWDAGTVLATATADATATQWTKYSFPLTLPANVVRRLEPASFAVSVEGDARVDIDQLSLMPADAIDGLDPDIVALAKAMNLTELRFGGNFSSYYNWRDGVGPIDKRVTMENIAWGIPEYNNFGTDEFLHFCDLIGAFPQFNLNMGSGSPEEAAAWVRYIRQHYKGRVLYEIGNELYGKWQVGYPTIDQLAARTLAFSQAVRAVAPDAEITATGQTPSNFSHWNAVQLGNPPGTFNYLSTHFIYATNHVLLPDASPDFIASAAYGLPYEVGRNFEQMQAQVDAMPSFHNKVHFAVTEWLFNSRGFGPRVFTNESPSSLNQGGAVMVGGFFNTLMRHSNITPIADMTGIMEFAGIWKSREQAYATPAYSTFQMYSTVKNQRLLPVTSDSGSYSIRGGVRPYDAISGIPYLDTIATLDDSGSVLTIFCVNRDTQRDLKAHFNLQGFQADKTVELKMQKSTSRYDVNDDLDVRRVVPVSSTAVASADGFTFVSPHESVTMLRFHKRR